MEEKQVLFCVESVYQLFNAITLRMTERAECPADLILSTVTTWDEDMVNRLDESKVFRNIFRPNIKEIEHRFWAKDLKDKIAAVNNLELFFDEEPIAAIYDEMFVPIDHLFWKMLYYFERVKGKNVTVYMYDEGVRAYTMELPKTDDKKYFENTKYAENSFVKAIKAYYLYQPELYSVEKYHYDLKQLPNPAGYDNVKETLIKVFGYEEMPKEPFIYLEDFFFADNFITNDFELFKEFANLVGKENIIIKRHPRDSYDRFSIWDYKTVKRSVVPWELQLLANDLHSKVLVSVSSTSILTPYIIFDSDMHVISFEKMFVGENPTHKDKAFTTFWEKMKKKINENSVRFHTPSSFDELQEVLRYIKMLQK